MVLIYLNLQRLHCFTPRNIYSSRTYKTFLRPFSLSGPLSYIPIACVVSLQLLPLYHLVTIDTLPHFWMAPPIALLESNERHLGIPLIKNLTFRKCSRAQKTSDDKISALTASAKEQDESIKSHRKYMQTKNNIIAKLERETAESEQARRAADDRDAAVHCSILTSSNAPMQAQSKVMRPVKEQDSPLLLFRCVFA